MQQSVLLCSCAGCVYARVRAAQDVQLPGSEHGVHAPVYWAPPSLTYLLLNVKSWNGHVGEAGSWMGRPDLTCHLHANHFVWRSAKHGAPTSYIQA